MIMYDYWVQPDVWWCVGLSLEVATVLFRTWLKEKDMSSLASGLKKANIDAKLLVSDREEVARRRGL